ncbi:MAG: histidine kinase [Bacteroidetes bacterium]|nr:histidine kinase [Bacteroidota bacterium]
MHPFLRNRKVLLLYLLAWGTIGGIFSLVGFFSFGAEGISLAVYILPLVELLGLVGLSSYYLCRAFPLQTTHSTIIFVLFTASATAIGIVCTVCGYTWAKWIDRLALGVPIAIQQRPFALLTMWAGGFLVFLLMSAIHYLIIGFEYAREAEKQTLALRLQAQEAELRALRAQLNPHFLFNSLNSILSLLATNPSEAEHMVRKLADFYRRGLKHSASETIPFKEELEVVDDYLAIEKVRFGDRLIVQKVIADEAFHFPVPSLILQPLIENALRHGIAQCVSGGFIRLYATVKKSFLHIRIENTWDHTGSTRRGSGTGLQNVRLRLRALYGSSAQLYVEPGETLFTVELILPRFPRDAR